ncbi:serine/threonine-protein kinase ATR [Drosophila eugracilis]|uniref:serine/threonine-protein kinase ATR n=1 Tax=Drosophila eugracilis TaxID=29029 RepID=UPI001BD9220D|nr:serine/threonine-protein kinase ATR [Drosophila eugracilis]XP_017063688.2 serine/threonine-protein kinase ATR [Drosophila eugracilis]
MSNQRKDMWKLLYNHVNRNVTNLSRVYSVIEDILCQEPSLISCSLVRELHNKFQDTFLLWLLNKLAKCLSETPDGSQCINLQRKILSSCCSNHPKLYERLVLAYVEALEETHLQLSLLDFSQGCDDHNSTITLRIFRCDVSCLQEFDPQCSFEDIKLPIEQADMYAKSLLEVLQHAHHIGYATHGDIFSSSLHQALLIIKECDMDTKLASLNYCLSVLRSQSATSWLTNPDVSHYAQLTLEATIIMWSTVFKWLEMGCMTRQELKQLNVTTKQLLLVLQTRGQPALQLGYLLLNEILSLPTNIELDDELLETLSSYIHSQLEHSETSLEQLIHLQQLVLSHWHTHPSHLLPILALMGLKQTKIRTTVVQVLTQSLTQIIQKKEVLAKEWQEVVAILRTFQQLEQLVLSQSQHKIAEQEGHIDSSVLTKLPLQCEIIKITDTNWNNLSMQLVEQESKCRLDTKHMYLEVCSLLMQVNFIRHFLKTQTQHQLLAILQRHMELSHLCAIRLETPSSAHTQMQGFYGQQFISLMKTENTQELFFNNLPQLYISGYIKPEQLMKALPSITSRIGRAHVIRLLLCSQPGTLSVFKVQDRIELYCPKCRPLPENLPGIYLGKCKQPLACLDFSSAALEMIAKDFLFYQDFSYISHHLDLLRFDPNIILRLLKETDRLQKVSVKILGLLVSGMRALSPDFMEKLGNLLLSSIKVMLEKPLSEQNVLQQRRMLNILNAIAHTEDDEIWLFHWFKMTFFFLVHIRSLVAQEAVLAATEMCASHGLQTINLWNCYKRDALNLAVRLALTGYLSDGVRFTRSLRALSKMLGFTCVQEFTCKYHRLVTAMVLPHCIVEPRSKGVLVLIAKQLRKPISTLFSISFLRLYTHVYLTEEPELANSCIELVVSCTQSSLQQLMNADVKQTVAELLIYFNRNPTFVMRSFQSLLQLSIGSEEELSSQTTNAEFANFIAERFLGVITYFESCLSEPSFEKPLKEETLYSLGQIMRFVGSQHVTQFRFKIIAMLSFVHTLQEPRLQRICLKIWHIFLHVVNVQELGPSLGRIVATLQPLLADSESVKQVNDLYEFIILRNASMLGNFITDLYFLDRMENVAPSIQKCIKRHTAHLDLKGSAEGESQSNTSPQLVEQLRFLQKHITDECLQVRVYALQHLGELFGRRRPQLNSTILSELPLEPLLEQIVNVLMAGCQHDDSQLQMASAKCLGELGAIDASYLPSNFNFASPQQLPLNILSDDFAVLALTSLCRGYQFQQKTKHVDSFSLAIQETLAVCGISPKEQKKVQLWQSLPARMRQVMEPMLHSCYTCCHRPSTCLQQPLFGSHYSHNFYEEWAFLWASRLIDYIQSSDTRHLLSSYKPCIKRDGNMLSTFYPYILLHALLECTEEQRKHIQEEFMAVLRANEESSSSVKGRQELGAIKENAFKQFESRKYAAGIKPLTTNSVLERKEDSSRVPRLAGKLCAELLDFLQRWLREWQRIHGRSTGGKPPETIDSNYRKIHEFLNQIPKLLVSRASYNCGEYARALSYLESYLEEGGIDKSKRLLEQFTFLVEVYGSLRDPDSVEGAVQVRSYDMSVMQDILVNRLVERQQDMITSYEQLLSSTDQMQPDHVRAMIDAYLRDTPKTAQLIADGLWQRLSDQYSDQCFAECKSELLWRLGSYDELEEVQSNWPAQCSQGCLKLRRPLTTRIEFDALLDGMRGSVLEQLRSCSAVQQHSYANAYDAVLKLHLVHELQCSQQLVENLEQDRDQDNQERLMKKYFEDWQYRLQVIQPQVRVQESIYSFRRNLLAELQRRLADRSHLLPPLQTELARIWLNSAQINRNAGQLQRAQLYILKAAEYKPTGLFIERAKLLWQKGDQVMAMNYLEEQLSIMRSSCQGNVKQLAPEQRHLFFCGKYLQAVYSAESMHLCADAVLKYFEEAILVHRQSESCYVQMAQFLEKIREAKQASKSDPNSDLDDMLINVMVNYARSLRYGSEHVYQSMPRLISLWLDTTETSTNTEQVKKMNDLLTNCCTALPTAMFYTVYSQMLSRLCHPLPEVFSVLRNVIIRLVEEYPQQSLWMLLPHFKSAKANRIKRCKLILTDSRLQNSTFQKLLHDFNSLTERLMDITNKEVTLDRTYKLSDLDTRLTKLCKQADFSNILLPFEKYMQPTLPLSSDPTSSTLSHLPTTAAKVNWFPYQQIYISGFQESVLVLRSAAKPKKLTIRCSDGQDYDVLVKPKDDLRRDARLMEFNGLVKRYLHQDAPARQRRLHIRTYAVLPFNEECGLVEWLPNLASYRSICMSLYAQRGQVMSGRQLHQLAVPLNESIERKREVFTKKLIPAHPPVFQEWLRQRFVTLHSWYEARNTYIRTVAVMSMVGYILGLGDRHGENILFADSNGDAVHVDFNCLFNQGELLAYPEVVPFRLTHNMTVAMGPLGVEGSYRKCCEITLRLLKQETKTLMSMLRPFVYDVGAQTRNGAATAKITKDVQRIADRLQGHVKRQQANSIPLSTEGQVNFLINEATKVDNLAAMYIGWGAFL